MPVQLASRSTKSAASERKNRKSMSIRLTEQPLFIPRNSLKTLDITEINYWLIKSEPAWPH